MKRPTSERTLTAEQFNQALQVLGWKQSDFARRVGMTPQTVGRWSSGQAACPLWLTEYLGAMQDLKALCARYLDRPGLSSGPAEDDAASQPPARLAHVLDGLDPPSPQHHEHGP
jgi:transcriptional regulator with XRE-family HTH domain